MYLKSVPKADTYPTIHKENTKRIWGKEVDKRIRLLWMFLKSIIAAKDAMTRNAIKMMMVPAASTFAGMPPKNNTYPMAGIGKMSQ